MDKYKNATVAKNMLFEDLQNQGVQPHLITLWKEKLDKYIHVESGDDFDVGNYYRWINLTQDPLHLNMGALLSNININANVLLTTMIISDTDSNTESEYTYSDTTNTTNTTNTVDGMYNFTFKSFMNKYFTISSENTYFFKKLTKEELDIVKLFSIL